MVCIILKSETVDHISFEKCIEKVLLRKPSPPCHLTFRITDITRALSVIEVHILIIVTGESSARNENKHETK